MIDIPVYYSLHDKTKDFYIKITLKIHTWGCIFLEFSSENEKLDYITIDENTYTHKQIEMRNGIVFMRMKKRMITPSNA